MIDFKVLVDTLVKGTPWAVLIAAIGAVWQLVYVYTRDKIRDRQAQHETELEEKKFQYQQSLDKQRFEYQKNIESMKFEYEQRRWREQLGLQLALKHVDARLEEYAKAWSYIEAVAKHRMDDGGLSPEITKNVASHIKVGVIQRVAYLRKRLQGTRRMRSKGRYGNTTAQPRVTDE